MFYPWARAVVWARDHEAKVIAPNWTQLGRLGVWLRWERDKRMYLNQFTNKGYVTGLRKLWLLHRRPIIDEKCLSDYDGREDVVAAFSGREEWNWMEPFKHEARFLRTEIERIANPAIVKKLDLLPEKFIGVHIRRGDFHYGDELLGDEYYLEAIEAAKKNIGEVSVLIFSDATAKELQFLSGLKNVKIMPKAPAIHDVLALARATAIVGTNHSTFSYWAAFLSCGKPSYWSHKKHKVSLPTDICPVFYI